MERQQPFTNELQKEIVITHTVTLARLLKLGKTGADAFQLYNFYCWCASWQLTNKVKATDSFCCKGLHWGRTKLRSAKNLLLKEKIVETVVRRNEEGKIVGHYVHIHYLNGFTRGTKNHPMVSTTERKLETNASDKKKNALNKKSVATATDPQSLLEEMLKDPRRHVQIIGIWAKETGATMENKDIRSSFIKRSSRAAVLLKGYKDEDIVATIKVLKHTDYLRKFTLETVGKYIDEVMTIKKKEGPKPISYEEVKMPDGRIVMRAIYKNNQKEK